MSGVQVNRPMTELTVICSGSSLARACQSSAKCLLRTGHLLRKEEQFCLVAGTERGVVQGFAPGLYPPTPVASTLVTG